MAWIAALATRYKPGELALYLLDFKESVSFAQLAPDDEGKSHLPHARLIGLNVNDDREFGLALLQFLSDEMRRRAAEAKKYQVTKLEDLRKYDPNGEWPRIVAVIDEFQYLFVERDAVSRTAQALIEDIARRGRSQGIHLVLASQDVSGIEAFWGRPAIFEQFVLRIALPRARRVLDKTNEAPLELPRWHAVLNHESGVKHGNLVVRVPNASAPGLMRDEVQRRLPRRLVPEGYPKPRTFDGSRTPPATELLSGITEGTGARRSGRRSISTRARPSSGLPDVPGRNLAVLGARRVAVRVLATAAAAALRATRRNPSRSCWRCWSTRRSKRPNDCAPGSRATTSARRDRARRSRPPSRGSARRSTRASRPALVLGRVRALRRRRGRHRVGPQRHRGPARVVHFGPETGLHVSVGGVAHRGSRHS